MARNPHGTAELKLMRGPTWRQSKQSKKAEIANYYYQWQIWKLSGKRKAKKNFTVFIRTPNRTGENYFEGYYRSSSSPWFREIKNEPQATSVLKQA
jgi:hypothetical protein